MSEKKVGGSAPAIIYAFKIIEFMTEGVEYRIQDIVREIGAPKSSILRYMNTLENIGVIWKNPVNRTYKINIRIVANSEEDPIFELKRKAAMQELCNLTKRTVEWFEPSDEGMVLRDRISPPENTVSAKVGIGNTLLWKNLLDSVRILAASHIFHNKSLNNVETQKYVSHGVLVQVSPAEAHELLEEAKKEKVMADEFCNTHGTRRISAVIEKAGKFVGVLSVIEVVLHPNVAKNLDYLPALKKQAEILSS